MSVTPEELAAFADGELSGADEARVSAAIDADAELAAKVAAHRKLKRMLSGHYAPILDQPLPDRLAAMLQTDDGGEQEKAGAVIDFSTAKARQEEKRRLPAWGWGGAAIAASLVAALVFTTRSGQSEMNDYAAVQLAGALDSQLVASQPASADNRILLSFRNEAGEFCRAYSAADASGIACRDERGWRFEALGEGSEPQGKDFRMAGSEADILEQAQDMATGGALNADEEAAALAKGWRD